MTDEQLDQLAERVAELVVERQTPPSLLTAEQAATRLQIPVSRVRSGARDGTIPSVRIGHYVRFRPADIDAYLTGEAS